jgi:hypothetical protein
VHVLGTERLTAGRATTKAFAPYHGGGILVWQDPGNYIRLEIATDIQKGKLRHYTNFEYRQNGVLAASLGPLAETGSAYLQLKRTDNEITAAFSADGAKWIRLPALKATLGNDLQVGVIAVNTASRPLSLRFEGFAVTESPNGTTR